MNPSQFKQTDNWSDATRLRTVIGHHKVTFRIRRNRLRVLLYCIRDMLTIPARMGGKRFDTIVSKSKSLPRPGWLPRVAVLRWPTIRNRHEFFVLSRPDCGDPSMEKWGDRSLACRVSWCKELVTKAERLAGLCGGGGGSRQPMGG